MLKVRVIITLTFNDGVLFRTKKFVPDYRYTTSYLSVDSVDEVFLIDITKNGPSAASLRAMERYSDNCFAPVTMGGWIRSVDDVKKLFDIGADKVVIGRAARENPSLLLDIAHKWGSQAAVFGLDVRAGNVGAASDAFMAQNSGAGEILLTDVERDGSLMGYNIPLLRRVSSAVSVPVVISGGCGGWRHMKEAFDNGADGCTTSVIHHFAETSLSAFKKALSNEGVPVRP